MFQISKQCLVLSDRVAQPAACCWCLQQQRLLPPPAPVLCCCQQLFTTHCCLRPQHCMRQICLQPHRLLPSTAVATPGSVAARSCSLLLCCLQPPQEAHAPDQKDDAAWPVGPRAGGPLLTVCGLHQHPLLLLPRHPQGAGQHLRHVCPPGETLRCLIPSCSSNDAQGCTGACCAGMCRPGHQHRQVRPPGAGDTSDARQDQGGVAPRLEGRLLLPP